MPKYNFSQAQSTGQIYLEASGPLGERIDFAWSVYCCETDENLRKKALDFLIYALDITNLEEINTQLIFLMAERERFKSSNPDYIPGKVPQYLPFRVKTIADISIDEPTVRL